MQSPLRGILPQSDERPSIYAGNVSSGRYLIAAYAIHKGEQMGSGAVRRSAIRTFVRQGISEHTAMTLSGHKTSSVFRRYDIVSPDNLREAARKLDSGLRS